MMEVSDVARSCGIIWTIGQLGQPYSLRCPPLLMWYFSDALLTSGASSQLDPPDKRLLRAIWKAIPYPFTESMQGSPFERVTMLAEACRYSLAAEGKGPVSMDHFHRYMPDCQLNTTPRLTVPARSSHHFFSLSRYCAFAVHLLKLFA